MWKIVLTTFAAVFVAELGDKTQFATLGLAAETGSRLAVFVGSAGALICTSLIATLAGGLVARWIPAVYLQRAAGGLFIALGALTLWRSVPGS